MGIKQKHFCTILVKMYDFFKVKVAQYVIGRIQIFSHHISRDMLWVFPNHYTNMLNKGPRR